MAVSYEATGRRQQKQRTRQALVAATRSLIAAGATPTVEQAAAEAGVARATAYRYFPNQHSLLRAAHPQIEYTSLLPADPPPDPADRLDLAIRAFIDVTHDWEPQLRTSLRLSLQDPTQRPPLRQGRAVGWIEDALTPLRDTHPDLDLHRLATAIRSATGIEALVWLTDVAGVSAEAATELMRWSAHAMLRAALDGRPPPADR